VSLATLLELGEWRLGEEAVLETRSKLFRPRELIAFSALAQRRLFRGHFDYCNFDTYAFVVQHCNPGNPGGFSFATRRRDSVVRHLWNAAEFAFLKPLHVAAHAHMKLDSAFLAAGMQADEEGSLPYEAIVVFNRANADSQDIPTHTEVILTKSAFAYLFEIGQSPPSSSMPFSALSPSAKWTTGRRAHLIRAGRQRVPKATRLLEAWAREFCDVRGGRIRPEARQVRLP